MCFRERDEWPEKKRRELKPLLSRISGKRMKNLGFQTSSVAGGFRESKMVSKFEIETGGFRERKKCERESV